MSNFDDNKIAILLMAAGSSSRLGQAKQLVELLNGEKNSQSLLHRQVELITQVALSINAQAYCVLGFESRAMKAHLATCKAAKQVTLIDNEYWQHGLSSSIAKGVSALNTSIEAVVILLVDQWQLSAEQIINLVQQWQKQPEKIYAAHHDGHLSPPVIFPRTYFTQLMTLSGDSGAKKVLKENKEQVIRITMPSAFIDLDTPEQLQALQKQHLSK